MVAERDFFPGFERRWFETGETALHFLRAGSGPPLLLLHGYPQTHVAWHRVAPSLAQDFTVILPDLPGYGASKGPPPTPEAYRKRAMARAIFALMDDLGFERFHLAGHDRGGRLGYRMALDAPERILNYAALDIVPTLNMWEQMNAERALTGYHWTFLATPAPLPEQLIGASPRVFGRHLFERWAGDVSRLDPAAIEAYLSAFEHPDVIAATCADYRAGASLDRADDLADRQAGRTLQCPVLVVWAEGYLKSKSASPLEIWRHWASDVQELALPCGHFVAEEEPEAVTQALRAFFAP